MELRPNLPVFNQFHCPSITTNVSAFANDTIWIANSQQSLQNIINLSNSFFWLNNIYINGKKMELPWHSAWTSVKISQTRSERKRVQQATLLILIITSYFPNFNISPVSAAYQKHPARNFNHLLALSLKRNATYRYPRASPFCITKVSSVSKPSTTSHQNNC